MKTARDLLLLSALTMQLPAYAAEPAVDTSKWRCKYCEFEEGVSGELEFGAGHVSDDSFKFGEYTGLHNEGGFFVGNADIRYRGEDAAYMDLSVTDVGLESRSLDIEGSRQGKYKLFLQYDEIPHYISDSAKTPFRNTGSDSLKLPAGWVTAPTTGGMTELDTSLRDVDLETERKRIGVGMSFIQGSHWEYEVKYRHETKEGDKGLAGSFVANAAQLVAPVDYITDEVDVTASYTRKKWQAKIAYYGSLFRNDKESLTWQNPFTPLVAGADTGQLALEPDNQFHQIVASGGYQLADRTRVIGDVAIGRMKQDEKFFPATQNPNLAVPLPYNRADTQVDTVTANFRVISSLTDKLRLNAAYTYNDRDNDSPRSTFLWVSADSFAATPRTNQPYSFTKSTFKVNTDYRFAKRMKAGIGYDYDAYKRTYQEVNKTKEHTVWGKLNVRARDNVDLTMKVAHADRDRSDYEEVSEIEPPQNERLRLFNMADRTRKTAEFHASITPLDRITLGLGVDYSDDDYSDSTLGLTESKETSVNADASVILTEDISLHAFLSHQKIESEQTGSQTFSTPDWTGKNKDAIDTAGIGVTYQVIKDKLDIGAD
ncbi:MAG: MtrB/PioB family decaheme-associated outer membrane protein, partial [Gammaproteobacteria bacterium]|nr:MtrB/PioB family decaheme-associated outer membrane protein [Gammaproteobacteria bacterium]